MELIERVAMHGNTGGWHWQSLFLNSDGGSNRPLFQAVGLAAEKDSSQEPPPVLPQGPEVLLWWEKGIKWKESQRKMAFIKRLYMGLFGGLSLIGPMLIMVLHSTKLTALLTTSLFIVFVAIALAYFMTDASAKDIMTGTAAYAAVLVVFVGVSITPGGSSY